MPRPPCGSGSHRRPLAEDVSGPVLGNPESEATAPFRARWCGSPPRPGPAGPFGDRHRRRCPPLEFASGPLHGRWIFLSAPAGTEGVPGACFRSRPGTPQSGAGGSWRRCHSAGPDPRSPVPVHPVAVPSLSSQTTSHGAARARPGGRRPPCTARGAGGSSRASRSPAPRVADVAADGDVGALLVFVLVVAQVEDEVRLVLGQAPVGREVAVSYWAQLAKDMARAAPAARSGRAVSVRPTGVMWRPARKR